MGKPRMHSPQSAITAPGIILRLPIDIAVQKAALAGNPDYAEGKDLLRMRAMACDTDVVDIPAVPVRFQRRGNKNMQSKARELISCMKIQYLLLFLPSTAHDEIASNVCDEW